MEHSEIIPIFTMTAFVIYSRSGSTFLSTSTFDLKPFALHRFNSLAHVNGALLDGLDGLGWLGGLPLSVCMYALVWCW